MPLSFFDDCTQWPCTPDRKVKTCLAEKVECFPQVRCSEAGISKCRAECEDDTVLRECFCTADDPDVGKATCVKTFEYDGASKLNPLTEDRADECLIAYFTDAECKRRPIDYPHDMPINCRLATEGCENADEAEESETFGGKCNFATELACVDGKINVNIGDYSNLSPRCERKLVDDVEPMACVKTSTFYAKFTSGCCEANNLEANNRGTSSASTVTGSIAIFLAVIFNIFIE